MIYQRLFFIQLTIGGIMLNYLDLVQVSGIVKVRDKLLTLDKPLRLESGEPSFDTPDEVKQAAIGAIQRNETHYVASAGILPLRKAISEKLNSQNFMSMSENDIVVTNGGMHALYCTFNALINEGDEVIIPTPNWTCVEWLITMTGASVVHSELMLENGFQFDIADVRSKITPKTKAILINSPHNPTGGILETKQLRELLELADEFGFTIISDEAYEHVIYDNNTHVSISALATPKQQEQIVSIFTFSKSYAMTGWRLGYLATKNELLLGRIKKMVLYSANGVNAPTQWAGIAALKMNNHFNEKMMQTFKLNQEILASAIDDSMYLTLRHRPKGAFYCFPKLSSDWTGILGDNSDVAFVDYLIEKGKLGCTAGSIFGPGGVGFIRFSYACSTDMVEQAAIVIRKFA